MKINYLFYLFWTSSLKVSTKGTKVKPFEAGGTRFYENPGFDCNSSNQGMKCSLQARIQFTFGTNKTAPILEPGVLQPTDTDSGRDYFISSVHTDFLSLQSATSPGFWFCPIRSDEWCTHWKCTDELIGWHSKWPVLLIKNTSPTNADISIWLLEKLSIC